METATLCNTCGSITNSAGSCISMTCWKSIYWGGANLRKPGEWFMSDAPGPDDSKPGLTEDDLRRVLREVIREEIECLKPIDLRD